MKLGGRGPGTRGAVLVEAVGKIEVTAWISTLHTRIVCLCDGMVLEHLVVWWWVKWLCMTSRETQHKSKERYTLLYSHTYTHTLWPTWTFKASRIVSSCFTTFLPTPPPHHFVPSAQLGLAGKLMNNLNCIFIWIDFTLLKLKLTHSQH